MKRKHLSLTALLVATLACPCAQQAWSAERAKLPASKKRPAPSKAPQPATEPATVICPDTPTAVRPSLPPSDSGILKLTLTTRLRQLPPAKVAPVGVAPAQAPAVSDTPPGNAPVKIHAPVPALATVPSVPAAPREAVEPVAPTPPAIAVSTTPQPVAADVRTPGPAPFTAPFTPPPAPAPWALLTPPPPRAYNPPPVPFLGGSKVNPYLPIPVRQAPAAQDEPARGARIGSSFGNPFSSLGLSIPLLPDSGQSILPKITKVYPTGEKPLVVVSFKCPTEVVGITPPTIKLLHEAVSLGMEGLNKTDLLSFDLQQVCQ